MLPRHDEIGVSRRIFEAVCITTAAVLLLIHWYRFLLESTDAHGWSLLFIPLGMAAADLLSGLVHWALDTWGSESMPVIGRRFLHPFRVHHVNPDDFLRRRFLDTNGDVATLVLPVLASMFWIPLTTATGGMVAAFALGFCSIGMWTNQVHQWAHLRNPPHTVRLLQACRVILGRAVHQRHHRPPYVTDYCIATGWCNGLLNRLEFFRRFERAVTLLTGVRPRTDEIDFHSAKPPAEGVVVHGRAERE